jgi:acyl-CoA reductase-like NAD-dependent aldehyde dehydrogenase
MAWLRRFRDAVKTHHVEVAELASSEVGKPEFEAVAADIMPLIASCNWHLRRGRALLCPRRVRGGGLFGFGHRVERHRMPVGRVLIIATWNYPVQLLGIQLIQALLAGNRVVVKPSERAPRTQARLMELAIDAASADPAMRGRIEVRSATREEGRRVLAEEAFDHVVFTGSTTVGRAIAEVCAARLIPTTLELSGSDSAIILGDADARTAARAVFMGFTANAGQTCMAPRRALVAREVHAAFTDELARLVAGSKQVTLVDELAAEAVQSAAADAIRAGGRSIAGALEPAAGRAMRPIAILDCPAETQLFLGQHFGPAIAVRAFDSLEEAFALHARAGQYLATSIWTRRATQDLAARVQACGSSLVHFNSVLLPSAHPAVAIAGHGASGWGSSRGESGLLALTREVAVTRSSTLIAPPVEEPSPKVRSFLSRMIAWPLRAAPSPSVRPELSHDSIARAGKPAASAHAHAQKVHS